MKLIIEDDEGRRTVVPLVGGDLRIGRNNENTVRLSEKNVSRKHARLVREEGRYFIEDLHSFTGVKVNGERIIGKRLIDEGDLIQISEYDLVLQSAPGEQKPPPLEDEDVIVTGPIPTDLLAVTEQDAATAVVKMENVAGAPEQPVRALGPMELARLVITAGPLEGKELSLARTPVAIGRTSENDVVLEDPSVSRFHCKLVLEEGGWKLLDNRSARGVKVNGEAHAQARVKPGDLIDIGAVKLRFEAAAPQPVAPPDSAPLPAAAARTSSRSGRKLLGLGVVALCAVALALFVVQRGRNARPSEDDGATVVTVRHDVIQLELGKARDALHGHKFAEALQHFEAAQRAGATAEELRGSRIAQAELRDEASLKKLDASIAANRFDAAKDQLDALGAQPGFFADQIRSRAAAVKRGYVDDHLARAEAMKAGSAETCAAEAQLVLAAAPESERAKALAEACSAPKIAVAPPATGTPATAGGPQVAQTQVAQAAPAAPSEAARAAPPEVARAAPPEAARAGPPEVARAAPEEAKRAAPHEVASEPARAEATMGKVTPISTGKAAEPAADPETQARTLAAEGNQKLLGQDLDGALQLFQRALALKPEGPVLAGLYRSMGIALTRQGNIEEGAHYYRLYLPLCTNPKESALLKTTLEEYDARRR